MVLTYFKRFRMEIDLKSDLLSEPELPPGYRFVPWDPRLLGVHADTKYQSFRTEIDANVFPCLGESEGCLRLMREIVRKDGFLPAATWLIARVDGFGLHGAAPSDGFQSLEYCGTIQGIRDRSGYGAVQNLGITPEHRGRKLGSALLLKALQGFYRSGLPRGFLEVTAQNEGAIRLYRRMGFRKARTVYKAVEVAYS
jgi:GNAT superfamily N-acetyltransferase